MKPTIKIIVTGTKPDLGAEFARKLSEMELTQHERKAPNPLSATKEEVALSVMIGRVEWEDVAVQMTALTAYRRYDFAWATLTRDLQGVLVAVDAREAEALDDLRHLLRLFARLPQTPCVIAVEGLGHADAGRLMEIQGQIAVACPVVAYSAAHRSSLAAAVRTLLSQMPAAE